ncbi:sister chromatid cohesion protein PDS5 [Streptomyces showdoensis]|uniref:Uncharacterized protein n=2 Tax=Streptomyces showdoensis TaxID=68268 RepID=A0A2P2GVT3_STREW|nr:hypothetical protein VO63_03970 [Streptomyces showdoensis]
MDRTALTRALTDGDEAEFAQLLDHVSDEELAGPEGIALLEAAARAGRAEAVRELVGLRGVDASRPWSGGVDPVGWAAGRGHVEVLRCLLSGTDAGLLLRRRALRVAEAALAADPAGPEARRAVISMVEFDLGIVTSPDELMARALVHADPGHADWEESLLVIARRGGRALLDWAGARAQDAPSLAGRRFALDALLNLGFGLDVSDDEDEDSERAFSEAAVAFLRPLLGTERDTYALKTVLHALSMHGWHDHLAALPYLAHADAAVRRAAVHAAAGALVRPVAELDRDLVTALLRRAADPDPEVRRTATCAFVGSLAHRDDVEPRILTAVLHLAGDPEPAVRTTAIHALYRSRVDTPALRGVLADRLDDAEVGIDVRIQAAGALAARGDGRGRAVLDEISQGLTGHRSPGHGTMGDVHHMLRTYAESRW